MAGRLLLLGCLLGLSGPAAARRVPEEDASSALQVRADARGGRQEESAKGHSHWVPTGKILNADTVTRTKKWHGVNFGNRFVPEDWIEVPYKFFEGLEPYSSRLALWDVQGDGAKHRMLKWLDDTITEQAFADMAKYGMEVVRLPVGYWNWVTYEGEDGPVVAPGWEVVGERMKNLHRIAAPEEYVPYFDRIFAFAKKYGLKILLDLHGLPGTQNGEIHSGACVEENGKNKPLFQEEANKQMAVKAIAAMAKYASTKLDALFGVQVINEPHLHTPAGHEFLKSYYEQAVAAAREHLDASVPIVLFEWTFDMHLWKDNAFPKEQYGEIFWDTHLYHFPPSGQKWEGQSGFDAAKMSYSQDLSQLRDFSRQKGNRALVGEFALAGPSFKPEMAAKWAQWMVDEFDFAASGSMLWTFDNQMAEWGMQQQVEQWGFDWAEIVRADRDPCVEGPRVTLKSGNENMFLAGQEDGSIRADSKEAHAWETWAPCYYKDAKGQNKVAFRSEAHGGWLSVTNDGQVVQAWQRSDWEEFSVPVLEDADGAQTIAITSTAHGSGVAAAGGTAVARPTTWTVA